MKSVENVVHQSVNVTTSATPVFGEDEVGNFLLLQNVSDADMYLSFTGAAQLNTGIYLRAGANLMLDLVIIDAPLSAIHGDSGTKKLLVTRA